MKTSRKDQAAIAALLSENYDDPYAQEDAEMVMEIEPSIMEEPVEAFEVEEDDHSDNEIIYTDVKKLAEYSKRLKDACKTHTFEPWMIAKLVKAADYVSDVWHHVDANADFANDGFESVGDEQDL
jgi:hypothetical protein